MRVCCLLVLRGEGDKARRRNRRTHHVGEKSDDSSKRARQSISRKEQEMLRSGALKKNAARNVFSTEERFSVSFQIFVRCGRESKTRRVAVLLLQTKVLAGFFFSLVAEGGVSAKLGAPKDVRRLDLEKGRVVLFFIFCRRWKDFASWGRRGRRVIALGRTGNVAVGVVSQEERRARASLLRRRGKYFFFLPCLGWLRRAGLFFPWCTSRQVGTYLPRVPRGGRSRSLAGVGPVFSGLLLRTR